MLYSNDVYLLDTTNARYTSASSFKEIDVLYDYDVYANDRTLQSYHFKTIASRVAKIIDVARIEDWNNPNSKYILGVLIETKKGSNRILCRATDLLYSDRRLYNLTFEYNVEDEINYKSVYYSNILHSRYKDSLDMIEHLLSTAECRITSEDPANNFKPDYGVVTTYRSASGFGIRLDAGSIYQGVRISPFFDSMLVKVSAQARTLEDASKRMLRALQEFRIRGIKTNIPFLQNLLKHDAFREGSITVNFIEQNPSLFDLEESADRGNKLVRFLAETIVNGNPVVKFLFEEMHRQRICQMDLSERVGLHRDTLRNWRTRYTPPHYRHGSGTKCAGLYPKSGQKARCSRIIPPMG